MSEPFIGEIAMTAISHAPPGWAMCEGQELYIGVYPELYSLIGVKFGGDGINTFRLPDLRGKAMVGSGQGKGLSRRNVGDSRGSEVVKLVQNDVAHSHAITVQAVKKTTTNSDDPANNLIACDIGTNSEPFTPSGDQVQMSMDAISIDLTGHDVPHQNMQPYLVLNFIIAVRGNFPLRP